MTLKELDFKTLSYRIACQENTNTAMRIFLLDLHAKWNREFKQLSEAIGNLGLEIHKLKYPDCPAAKEDKMGGGE